MPRSTLPVYVAARGHKMLEMAGAHADGVMLASHASSAGLHRAMQIVDQGCRQAGRTIDELALFTRIDLALDEDRSAARRMVRPAIASFLTASYPDRNFEEAAGLQVPAELEAICRQRDDDLAITAGHLVPEEFIDAFTWAGTPAEVAHQVTSSVDLGISNITYVPQPSSSQSVFRTIEQFATQVVPRVRALLGS